MLVGGHEVCNLYAVDWCKSSCVPCTYIYTVDMYGTQSTNQDQFHNVMWFFW